VLAAQGNLTEALQTYRDSLAITERLAKGDLGNADWQYGLGITHERIGDILMQQASLAAALTEYEGMKTIIERLAKADPGNAGWQHDLSVSYAKLGSTYLKLGEAPEALIELREGREIIVRLVTIVPQWKKDLAWFDAQIARLEGQTQEAGRD
jgi:tetratricopeptide (TPR) repeat protein